MSKPDLTIISLGAGVQSSVMALMAARGEIGPMPDCAIFSDTGWEPKKIYDWLGWLEKELPFPVYRVSAGNIKQDCLNEKNTTNGRFASIPFFTESNNNKTGGQLRRQCTREYKIEPVRRKIRDLLGLKPKERAAGKFNVEQWIGISTDEIVRMKDSRDKWITNRWPLIEQDMARYRCLNWMAERQYPKPSKSSCIGCPFHNNAAWREMKIHDPISWNDAVDFDKKIRKGIRGTKEKLYLHRSLKPLDEIDLRNAKDLGQLSFLDECDGMCGI